MPAPTAIRRRYILCCSACIREFIVCFQNHWHAARASLLFLCKFQPYRQNQYIRLGCQHRQVFEEAGWNKRFIRFICQTTACQVMAAHVPLCRAAVTCHHYSGILTKPSIFLKTLRTPEYRNYSLLPSSLDAYYVRWLCGIIYKTTFKFFP